MATPERERLKSAGKQERKLIEDEEKAARSHRKAQANHRKAAAKIEKLTRLEASKAEALARAESALLAAREARALGPDHKTEPASDSSPAGLVESARS